MDTDDVYEELVKTMKKEFINYFESMSLYQNYGETVENFKMGRSMKEKETKK